ncbi:MAG: T9SS type A sorting domain-containing protein [candidate division Zixibacteria bacterium]|nr:T9SS type A sorting domain-containing protein [candidate division Zixibacteria bacterium]
MRKTLILTGIMLAVIAFAAIGNTQEIIWSQTYGGDSWDGAFSAQATTDGGYVLAGATNSFGAGGYDFYVIKADGDGNVLWQQTYGGTEDEWANSIKQTSDGGYIIVGYTTSFQPGGEDFYLVRIDANGTVIWTLPFGTDWDDRAESVDITTDGGFIVAGYNYTLGNPYNAYLVRFDSNGNGVWAYNYGGFGDDYAYSVQQTSDGGFVFVGATDSWGGGQHDFYVAKTDADGNYDWWRTFGSTMDEWAYSVTETSDGDFVVAGYKSTFAGSLDAYLVKFDSEGNTIWANAYGGVGDEIAYSVKETPDSGYILAGVTDSWGAGSDDFYYFKIDSEGAPLWETTYGSNQSEIARSVDNTNDGNYIVAGYQGGFAHPQDVLLIKVGEEPPPCCEVDMVPDVEPIIVPAGGTFGLTGYIGNPTDETIVTDVWVGVKVNGDFIQLWYFPNIPLNTGQTLFSHLNQQVPGNALPGEYEYRAHCGDIGSWTVCDRDSFIFTVTEARQTSRFADWNLEGGWGAMRDIPRKVNLIDNYPNPFNATTTITFDLPEAGNVELGIYNVAGQKITSLVNEHKEAGNYAANWDASRHSSGIYFCNLRIGELVATKKISLVK